RGLRPGRQGDVVAGAHRHALVADAQRAFALDHVEGFVEHAVEMVWEGGLARRHFVVRAAEPLAAGVAAERAHLGGEASPLLDVPRLDSVDVADGGMTPFAHLIPPQPAPSRRAPTIGAAATMMSASAIHKKRRPPPLDSSGLCPAAESMAAIIALASLK